MTADDAKTAMDVLLEQEKALRFDAFGATEALELGNAVELVSRAFAHGVSATIVRETDDLVMFQWVADDCDGRNILFAQGVRLCHLAPGACSVSSIATSIPGAWSYHNLKATI